MEKDITHKIIDGVSYFTTSDLGTWLGISIQAKQVLDHLELTHLRTGHPIFAEIKPVRFKGKQAIYWRYGHLPYIAAALSRHIIEAANSVVGVLEASAIAGLLSDEARALND